MRKEEVDMEKKRRVSINSSYQYLLSISCMPGTTRGSGCVIVIMEPQEAHSLCQQGDGCQTDNKEMQSLMPRNAKFCKAK